MTQFGPPAFGWDGGVDSRSQKTAVASYYELKSVDAGPNGTGVVISGGQTTQQNGYQIQAAGTWIATVPNGTVAVLPETSAPFVSSLNGLYLRIYNNDAQTLTVFPHPADIGGTINGLSSVSVPANTAFEFQCSASGQWQAGGASINTATSLTTAKVVGGSLASSTLTLESTSGAGTTDFINFLTGSQVEQARIDSNGLQAPTIRGGTGAASTLTLESTSGAGTTDFIRFLAGSQVEQARIDGGGLQAPLIRGGTGTGSTLTLESTSGAGTTDAIRFLSGAQVLRALLDTNGNFWFGNFGFGYGPAGGGVGGTVSQATSKSTTVVLSKATGQITMNAAALGASTTVTFALTNTLITATDILVLTHDSGGTAGSYTLNAQTGSGTANINVRNVSLGSLSEAIVIGFAIIKAVTN